MRAWASAGAGFWAPVVGGAGRVWTWPRQVSRRCVFFFAWQKIRQGPKGVMGHTDQKVAEKVAKNKHNAASMEAIAKGGMVHLCSRAEEQPRL